MTNAADADGQQEQPQVLRPQSGPDKDEMASDYLPEGEDWLAKTALDINDPQRVAALHQFGEMFPEVEGLQPMIDEFVQDFLKGRTSVNAQSREEYTKILQSMFGKADDDNDFSKFAEALGAGEGD